MHALATLIITLALPAAAAHLNAPRLGGVFDGSGTGPKASLRELAPGGELDEPGGEPFDSPSALGNTTPTPDLIQAKARWGIEAQKTKLAGAGPAGERFTLAVLGDVENGRFPWQRIFAPKGAFRKQVAAIHAMNPDLIMQLGDFVSKGVVERYRKYVETIDRIVTLPMFHVIGNHDRSRPNGSADKNLYHAVFGDGDFFIDHKGWRFVALDSSNYEVTDAQLDWLDRILATGKKTLVFTHVVPAYMKGQIHSEGPNAQVMSGYFDGGSARFGEIVAARRVERVYMGHIHSFGVGMHKGVKYVVTAGGGSPLYPLPPGYPERKKAHFVTLDLGPDGVSAETVHEMDGTTFPVP